MDTNNSSNAASIPNPAGPSGAVKGGNAPESMSVADEEVSTTKKREKHDLTFVSDVPLEVHVELGRIPITIRSLLSLKKGSVLELEKLAGEPLEILINDKLICRGEVIVVNEKYGIRMTDIIKPAEFELNTP